ncbi:MAG: hypothetical protein FWG82_05125 [Oscillospiraceae bacterium]|nr:hypothetical protein [Oscillospiraceae bacterium]
MSYNSKKTVVSMATGILLAVIYIIYALGDRAPAPDDVKAWAVAMLIFIGIGVTAMIVIMVLFHIAFAIGIAVKENDCDDKEVERIVKSSMVEDERDKLIERKSTHIEHTFVGMGLIAALIALACAMSIVAAVHIMLGATIGGMLIGGCQNIYYHERGV